MAIAGSGGPHLEFAGGKSKLRFNPQRRLLVIVIILSLGAASLLGRALYLATSDAHQGRTNLVIMTRVPQSLGKLDAQNQKIAAVAANIDSHSLNEIKRVLDETSRIAGRASLELKAQSDAWEKIKSKTNVDASTYQEVQKNLELVGALQSNEIVRLKKLLEESGQPSLWEGILGHASSFFLGVISSLAAAGCIKGFAAWRSRRRARLVIE